MIAEKIFGYIVTKIATFGGMGTPIYKFIDPEGNGWEGLLGGNIPGYSINMKDAWDVVEKLRQKGFTVDVHAYPENREWLEPPYGGAPAKEWVLKKDKLHYQCSLSQYHEDIAAWISFADPCGESPAHAICLAALSTLA